MRNVWNVLRYEFTRNIRRKGFLFTAFGIPLLAALLFGAIQVISQQETESSVERMIEEQQNSSNRLGYVDQSGLFPQAGLLQPFDSEDAAQAAMEAGEIEGYYLIAEDYVETGALLLVVPRFSLDVVEGSQMNRMFYENVTADIDPAVAMRLQSPTNTVETIQFARIEATPTADASGDAEVQRDEEGQTAADQEEQFWLVYGFAMVFMLALFGTNGYLMQTVIEEKETRIVEILVATVRPLQLLTGKILALGALGIFQVIAWVGTMLLLGQVASNIENLAGATSFLANIQLSLDTFIIVLIYFVLGYLFFAAVFGAVGAISVSMSEGPNYATVFTIPLILPFLFLTVFTETPNAALPVFMSIFPLTSPLSMVMRLTITDVPFAEMALSIVLLIVADVFMIWLAGRFFRAQSLLAGQVPKLRDLPALIRG